VSVTRILQVLGIKNVNIVVTLKPTYLEKYRDIEDSIEPDFFTYTVSFDPRRFRQLIKDYGNSVAQFGGVYGKWISGNIDKIATALWEKDPIPITILDYYKELISIALSSITKNMTPLDALTEAEKLPRAKSYYRRQFELLRKSTGRSDSEFLYTLQLCYELGLNRTEDRIKEFQKGIFGSSLPIDPLRRLANWIYLSGQYYSMHDAIREGIRFDDAVKAKIISFLASNFLSIVGSLDPGQNYQLALFFGKNIQFMPSESPFDMPVRFHPLIPNHIFGHMRNNLHFELGLGVGCGESIALVDEETGESTLSIDENLRKKVLKGAETDIEFARGLGDSLGH
jgi:hypothetical protein